MEEEGKSMEEVEKVRSLRGTLVHEQIETDQEQKSDYVDGLELVTQKSVCEKGVELPSHVRSLVDFDPNVVKTNEDVGVGNNPANEVDGGAECDKLGSNVGSEKIENGENGCEEGEETLRDDMGGKVNPCVELSGGAETGNLIGDGVSCQAYVPVEIKKEGNGVEEGNVLKDGLSNKEKSSNEPDSSVGTDNVDCKMEIDTPRDGEVSMEKPMDGVSNEANPSNELDSRDETGNVACKMEIDMPRDIDGLKNEANPSSEQDNSGETNNVAWKMEIDMPHDSEVPMEKLIDGMRSEAPSEPRINAETEKVVCKVEPDTPREVATGKQIDGASSKAKASNEPHISAETDNSVCKVEPDMACGTEVEVAMEEMMDAVSSEAKPSNEPHIHGETDDVVCQVEQPDMPHDSEVAKERMRVSTDAKPSNEQHIRGQTDNVVCQVEPDLPRGSEVATEKLMDGVSSEAKPSNKLRIGGETGDVVCQVEPNIPCDSEVATEKLMDGVSSKAKPSNAHIGGETGDAICQVEPDIPRDVEVATKKVMDGVSSEANPSNEPPIRAETDDVVCEVEPDIPRDKEVALEKRINVVSSEGNPSNELYMTAETDTVFCKVEPDGMPCDSGVAMGKVIDGCSKANPSNVPHMSAEPDNVVKVVPNIPGKNEVEMETESDDYVEKGETLKNGVSSKTMSSSTDINEQVSKPKFYVGRKVGMKSLDPKQPSVSPPGAAEDDESGTAEEQAAFMKEVENVYKERNLEFKAPKFYKEELNLLKLWRAVIKLGGYEKVTSCKLWRQVGESFNPPKTCTTVSWTFRIFYEKALIEFEKHKVQSGELSLPAEASREPTRVENPADGSQTLGSGRALRDAAARAMQGWHSQRLHGNGEVSNAIIKDKHLSNLPKSDKQIRIDGTSKRKRPSHVDCAVQVSDMKAIKPRLDNMVFDIGPPADWVKVNVKRFNDCFEIYALVPGLLREEVHVQCDPAGRLIISCQPTQLDNPWGVTPFKKVVSLPSRIDPHQTSAVVTLNGQLFVRVPFEQSDF